MAYGYAAFDDTDPHTLRCYVTVDGVERASTPTATGQRVVLTAGRVTYQAPDAYNVGLCTELDGVTVSCGVYVGPDFPPQEVEDFVRAVVDLAWGVVDTVWDQWDESPVCPVLAALAPGVPGVVDISVEGDTTVAGFGRVVDCPPYGNA